ncbi:hypothetical protein Cme02nite_02210 [Catellatospora methionotrophica]|uniref:Uncharacterized protein n=1 Tax=Catellatospora methionotrophica TaxID=121620 RepID=A0A8J3LA38_9ACTN|nr:hypothetical protein [Catellatospora methionotrophica]GIG11889.1 hypothetical protein Cme02nite_02210 [Catellatospora methionotrophica]
MTINEGTLWQAGKRGRNWARWFVWAAVTPSAAYLGLLRSDSSFYGYLLVGAAGLAAVIGIVYWFWDRPRVVEIKLLDSATPVLAVRTVSGRVDQVDPQDVGSLHLDCLYPAYDPDSYGQADIRNSDNVLLLRLRDGRSYRTRPTAYMHDSRRDALWAEWQRLCPRATARTATRFRTSGTND